MGPKQKKKNKEKHNIPCANVKAPTNVLIDIITHFFILNESLPNPKNVNNDHRPLEALF